MSAEARDHATFQAEEKSGMRVLPGGGGKAGEAAGKTPGMAGADAVGKGVNW